MMNSRHEDCTRGEVGTISGRFRRLWADENGITSLEYALLLALTLLSALVAWQSMGDVVADSVEDSAGKATPAVTVLCGGADGVPSPNP